MGENLFGQDSEIDKVLRSFDWSQTPLGDVETWSDSLRRAVQIRLAELHPVQPPEKMLDALPSQTVRSAAVPQTDAFRVRLSDALRPLSDANEVQAIAARLLGEAIAASRVIYLEVAPNGEEVIVPPHYTNGVAKLSGRYRLEDYQRSLNADHQAGRTQVVTDIPHNSKYTDDQKARYGAVEIAAHIDVPLIKNDRFVALLVVHQSSPRQWTEAEVKQVEETAEQTWAAVERARAEAALRESEAKYRTLFESIDEGYFIADVIFDADDRPIDIFYLEANPAIKRLTGLDVAGRSLREIDPNYESHWWKTYGRVAQTGRGERQELYAEPLKSWFSFYAFKVGDANSRRVACVFQDVTDRIQAEAALRQSEARFRTLISASSKGLYRVSADWSEMYELQGGDFISDTAEPISDWLQKYIYLDDQARVLKAVEVAIQTKGLFELEHRVRQADGTLGWTYSRAVPLLDRTGEIIEWFGEASDITDRKRIEQEREQLLQREQTAREAAEAANRIKDEFLAVLSHELRSPLNPILGWTRLLQTSKLDADRQADALQTIERNAKLQAQLIEDLLDISRIMRGKLTLKTAPVNLKEVVTAAIETVRLAAQAKQIEIALDLDPVALIRGDAARLQQVMWNLLTNAVKFTPHGGQVTIELRQRDRSAQLRVSDTGKGITFDFLPHVFEYFRQEDGSTTRNFGGLGLGLAIVRQIVELHGGTITAESRGKHQGATFTVQLPLRQAIAPTLEPTDTQPISEVPLANVQILLVDDEIDTREFEAFLLEQHGAKVTAVASGIEALQALDRFVPDVLVSDVGMAEMDGYMLIEQIRSRPAERGGTIRAIALTAYAAQQDQQKAQQAGFQLHLSKPVEAEALVRAIVNLCSH